MNMKGSIKFFNEGKGYGFVTADDGKDYFVHITGVEQGYNPRDGDAVSFEVEQGDRGPKAVNVKRDDGSAAPAAEPAEEAPAEDAETEEEEVQEEAAEEAAEDEEEDKE